MRHYFIRFAVLLLCIFLSGCTIDENIDSSLPSEEQPLTADGTADEHRILLQQDENPIDNAFAYAETLLSEEQVNSVSFAYLYARQWYYELDNIFRTENPYNFGLSFYGRDNYISGQAENTRLLRGLENTPFNYFILIGDFLRSETLRFKEIIREEGGDAGYLVREQALSEKLMDTQYVLSGTMLPNVRLLVNNTASWCEESPLLLIAEVPEKSIFLYYAEPFGMLLDIHGQYKLLDWPSVSPRAILPEMTVSDLDNDGEEEIIVTHTWISGLDILFVSAQSLYVIEYDNHTGIVDSVSVLEPEFLSSVIGPEFVLQENAESISFIYHDQTISFPKPEMPDTDKTDEYLIQIGDLTAYDLDAEPIKAEIGIIITCNTHTLIEVIPCTADVNYTGKGYPDNFIISNIRIFEPE